MLRLFSEIKNCSGKIFWQMLDPQAATKNIDTNMMLWCRLGATNLTKKCYFNHCLSQRKTLCCEDLYFLIIFAGAENVRNSTSVGSKTHHRKSDKLGIFSRVLKTQLLLSVMASVNSYLEGGSICFYFGLNGITNSVSCHGVSAGSRQQFHILGKYITPGIQQISVT